MKVVIGFVLTLLLVMISLPAQAQTDPDPTIHWPLPMTNNRIDLQIEGPSYIWGMRDHAEWWDERLPNVEIYTTGTCAENPDALCLKVEKYSENSTTEGQAIAMFTPEHGTLEKPLWIGLNTYSDLPKWWREYIAKHEFMHILGMGHHLRENGIMGNTGYEEAPSRAEKRVVFAQYN